MRLLHPLGQWLGDRFLTYPDKAGRGRDGDELFVGVRSDMAKRCNLAEALACLILCFATSPAHSAPKEPLFVLEAGAPVSGMGVSPDSELVAVQTWQPKELPLERQRTVLIMEIA